MRYHYLERESYRPKLRTMCGVAMMTTLFCISAVPVGIISLGLKYTILSISCSMFGLWSVFVCVVGGIIRGVKLKLLIIDIIIGLGCGYVFKKTKTTWIRILTALICVEIGSIGINFPIDHYINLIPFYDAFLFNFRIGNLIAVLMIFSIYIAKKFD